MGQGLLDFSRDMRQAPGLLSQLRQCLPVLLQRSANQNRCRSHAQVGRSSGDGHFRSFGQECLFQQIGGFCGNTLDINGFEASLRRHNRNADRIASHFA